jgi:anti-anti-sigma factor
MPIAVREAGKVRIIDINGRLVMGTTDPLKEKAYHLLGEGHRCILLNLHNVPHLDSAGIGVLAACKKRALEKEGQIKILKPRGKYHLAVETVIELMFAGAVFEDELKAVGSF